MTWRTSLFLVLLQLAIGIHLLYEGVWKVQNPSWTSEGYLRGSTGPLALPTRWTAGDPNVTWENGHFVTADSDASWLTRFTVTPFKPSEAMAARRWQDHMPPPLEEEWNSYYKTFLDHYQLGGQKPPPEYLQVVSVTPGVGLTGPIPVGPMYLFAQPDDSNDHRRQRVEADVQFLGAKADTVKWLVEGIKKKTPTWFTGEVPMTTPQRVEEYQKKLQEIHDQEGQETTFGAQAAKLAKARDEAKTLKKELLGDLDDQTATMKKRLRDVLTYEQKRMAPMAEESKPKLAWSRITWVDNTVRWGLLVVGAGLVLGLFTRLACVGGALLLLLFYLAMPPWPGLMEGAASKGHYLFVNENIIEILALLVIATSCPSSRYGLDALLPFPRRRRGPSTPVARPARGRHLEAQAVRD